MGCVFLLPQARCATSPTPSSPTSVVTSACTLTAAPRSSVKTVGSCSALPPLSTSTVASVRAKIIMAHLQGCSTRASPWAPVPSWPRPSPIIPTFRASTSRVWDSLTSFPLGLTLTLACPSLLGIMVFRLSHMVSQGSFPHRCTHDHLYCQPVLWWRAHWAAAVRRWSSPEAPLTLLHSHLLAPQTVTEVTAWLRWRTKRKRANWTCLLVERPSQSLRWQTCLMVVTLKT